MSGQLENKGGTEVMVMRCPKCGLTLHAPQTEELPDGGAVCAMGHEATAMAVVKSNVGGTG